MSKPHRHFQVGDLVRYEVSDQNGIQPRWNLNQDTGATGRFKHGKIVKADKTFAQLRLSTGRDFTIPQPVPEIDYLWNEPGFYELVNLDDETPVPKKLVMSMRREINPSCDCGKDRSGAPKHYSWCSMVR